MKNGTFRSRLKYALSGLSHAFKNEKSVRTQAFIGVSVYAVLFYAQPALVWWAVVTLLVCAIIATEVLNSAIENLCDYVEPRHSESIKIVKDLCAGAVLVLSIGAVLIGCILLVEILTDSNAF